MAVEPLKSQVWGPAVMSRRLPSSLEPVSPYSVHVPDPASSVASAVAAGLPKFTSRKDSCNAEREFLQGATVTEASAGSDDIFGLSTESLSRLRSPSVLEVREKGYERLKEELAKAQRVRNPCCPSRQC